MFTFSITYSVLMKRMLGDYVYIIKEYSMNRPPETFVSVQEDRLLAFSTACFEKAGLSHDHAALISRLLVNSDLRGVRSHGTRTVNGYCSGFENGDMNPQPNIRQIHETPTAVVLDGDGTLGYLPMVRATEGAIAKAKEVGLGMGLVRHIGHYGSAGHYTRLCMEAGCIGFSVQGYQNLGNAAGSDPKPQLGYFGNPPLCFAIPGGDEPSVVLDVATSIMADYQRGEEYDALLSLIPAAFFKSMGYTAVAGLLGGGLTGYTLPDDEGVSERWPGGARLGGMVLAIHVDAVVPEAVFRAETDRMVRDVRETFEPMPGYDRALLPGGIEVERFETHRREGIRYGEMEQESAREVSERLGVPLPWD
jgi:LDH2 family malate/lactate/ureidoglycolate dehydrogenase